MSSYLCLTLYILFFFMIPALEIQKEQAWFIYLFKSTVCLYWREALFNHPFVFCFWTINAVCWGTSPGSGCSTYPPQCKAYISAYVPVLVYCVSNGKEKVLDSLAIKLPARKEFIAQIELIWRTWKEWKRTV